MKKLTSDTAHSLLARMKENATYVDPSIHEGYMIQALEIALPVLEQQEKGDDGWIEWGGGDCPVEIGTLVEFEMRDGDKDTAMGAVLDWPHENRSDDIIAYRVIEPQEKTAGKHQEGE